MLIPRHSVVMSTCELGHIHRELTQPPSHRYSWPHISVQKTELRSNQLADNHIHTQADSAVVSFSRGLSSSGLSFPKTSAYMNSHLGQSTWQGQELESPT